MSVPARSNWLRSWSWVDCDRDGKDQQRDDGNDGDDSSGFMLPSPVSDCYLRLAMCHRVNDYPELQYLKNEDPVTVQGVIEKPGTALTINQQPKAAMHAVNSSPESAAHRRATALERSRSATPAARVADTRWTFVPRMSLANERRQRLCRQYLATGRRYGDHFGIGMTGIDSTA